MNSGGPATRFKRSFCAAIAATLVAVPLALAQSGDPDESFGNEGFAKLPTDHRYSIGSPMLQSSGRIVVAGLLKEQSNEVFLSALEPNGDTDSSFGSDGEVQTGLDGSWWRAQVSMAQDQGFLVAGKSPQNGQLVVKRYLPDGSPDSTWGAGGTVTANLGNSYKRPTAIVPVGQSSALVAAESTPGKRKFTLTKIGPAGTDNGFGDGGVATFDFKKKDAIAHDIAVLSSGKILLAGSVRQSSDDYEPADTALVRLHSDGSTDPSFGSGGGVIHNFSGEDFALAIAPLADGRTVLTGPANGDGMVARIGTDGSLDSSFGDGGKVVGDFIGCCAFVPTDVAVDSSGRPVVAGGKLRGSHPIFRWAVVRLTPDASPKLDSEFGQDGHVAFDECANSSVGMPSGLTLDGSRILLAGGCESTARTTVARLATAAGPPSGPIELSVSPGSEAAGHERIPIAGLDPSAAIDAAEDAQATAMRRTAMRRTAMRRTDMLSTAMRRTAMRRTGILSTAMRRTALRGALLSEVSLTNTTWQELLGTDAPLQTLTLEDAYEINPDGVGALTLGDIDLNSTAMRRTSLAAIVLGVRPLAALPAPDGGWCNHLADQPYNCSNGADPQTSTLVDLEILGDDLSAYYESPISLRDTDLGSGENAAPLADFRLADLDLSIDPFGDAKASEFAAILACGDCGQKTLGELTEAERGDATIRDLVGLLPKPSLDDVSVGDVILAMLDHAEIPYESLALDGLLGEATYRGDDLVTYTATSQIDCSQSGDLSAVLAAPGDARPVPDGASASLDGGPPRSLGNGKPAEGRSGPYSFALAPACDGQGGVHDISIEILVEPGSVLGPIDGAQLAIRAGDQEVVSNAVTTTVDDSRDPGDDPDNARAVTSGALLTGHLSSSTDSDFFTFEPQAGRTTISLSHLPDDYDLVVYGPAEDVVATAMRRTAMRRTAMRRTPVEDDGEEPLDEASLAPDQIQDIAMRRTDLTVRATSIQRGAADEAASVVVRPEEAGETFVAQVVGYNGAFSASPYVLRRSDAPAANPPACPPRSLDSGASIAYPGSIPASTRALYLVDPARMTARDGGGPTQSMLTTLADLADETDGVVLPVQGNPRVSTSPAFAAWDADPCSVEAANGVVTAINEVVDDAREQNGGLPELRSIVLVGPDEVLPQARIADRTVIGQASDYADDAIVDRNGDGVADDNSTSAAFRQGYFLSDDPYGDFDPAENIYTPDVALGRLVETPGQIEDQIAAYMASDGTVNPQRSYVAGYDFLTDAANEIHGALSGAVPDGSAQSRIDEDWTAADALSGLNAPGAGFLSVNAHYDHFRALPAASHSGADDTLLFSSEADVPAGSVAFTVGCHSGLNLAVSDASSPSAPALGDWAEQMGERGAIYAANTSYGYGDDAAVAYSELVMADYARGLVAGTSSTGQALMLAKQSALASSGVPDTYWVKASMEATFYGLPMYRVEGASEAASVVPALPDPDEGENPTTRSSTPHSVDLRERLSEVSDERGTYWKVEGEDPLVVNRRPIQPKLSEDVTSAEGPAHGYLLESLTTIEGTVSDPAVARATIDQSQNEPEPAVTDPFFPAAVATVEPVATTEGRRDLLTLMAGSFRGDRQRLNLDMGGRVLRSSSNDYSPPTIRRVDGLVADGGFSIRVEADDDDILGGTIIYLTDEDKASGGEVSWHRANLSVIAPGILSAGGTLPSGTSIPEAIVQVYDRAYNVAYSDRKVEGHTFAPAPPSEEGDPRVVFDPAPPESGYYSSPPTVSLDRGDHEDASFEVSVDGGAFEPADGPFTVREPAEGEHLVTYRGSDGSIATARFAVDRQGPSIVAEADRPANENGWYDGPVTFSFECADAVSGPADCPEPRTLDEAGANQGFTVTASDRAGNSSDLTVDGISIDLVAPAISATPTTQPNSDGWYRNDVTIRFDCEDDLSGLAHCGTRSIKAGPNSATEDEVVTGEGRDIQVPGQAIDRAGHSASASATVSVDRTRPTAAITSSGLITSGSIQGTASDALSGVKTVTVTYTGGFGQTVVRQASSINCNENGQCTWSAPTPGPGIWRATARSHDRAGNQSPESETSFLTIR